jgi:hypothetical protein
MVMRLSLLVAVALAACSPYSPDLPYSPFLCGSGTPACPDGFACTGMDSNNNKTCVSTSAKMPDAGSNVDGMCANDSQVEGANRNDTIANAFPLPDPLPNNGSIKLSALAICPMGDVDNYSLIINANHEINAQMTYESWGAPLSGEIRTAAGQPVKTMGPLSGMDRTLSADAASLPAGQYIVKIYGPSTAPGQNNYTLTVTVTPFP